MVDGEWFVDGEEGFVDGEEWFVDGEEWFEIDSAVKEQ